MSKKSKGTRDKMYTVKCPKCKSSGPFNIEVKGWATISDGEVDVATELGWNNESRCLCIDCGYSAKLKAFER